MNLPDGAIIGIVTGVFGFLALIPAYLINRRSARKSEFDSAQKANQQAFTNLRTLYQEQSKRLDEVVADNKHYRAENLRLLTRNAELEDENRAYIKENAALKSDISDLRSRVKRLEGANSNA